ncbi:MAG: YesL family protein [Lachnospiraceae bacterium]|nr:YesL family protein [Lachnospiraceae bacterium]
MNFFEEGSPFQRFLNKMTDLLILNLITLLMCLPVITAGAALTAMHYVLLKMVRGEEGYIVQSFFRVFKREFRQATAMWIVFMALAALMVSTLVMVLQGGGSYPLWLPSSILVVAFIELMCMIYAFAMQSRFDNSVYHTIVNAVTLTFGELLSSLKMAVITLIPPVAVMFAGVLLPFLILFGLSVPGYACAMIYDPIFRKLEKQIWEQENSEDREEEY